MEIIWKIDDGPAVIAPDIHNDERGYFFESFREDKFNELVDNVHFVQENQSMSSFGTLRGMHAQKGEFAQAKLVSVVKGKVLDVIVDARKYSENYGKVYSQILSEENHYQFYVPRGFYHGFLALSDIVIFQYKCDNYYNKESEINVRYDSIGFDWNQYISNDNLILSEKDKNAPEFKWFYF